MDPSDEGESSPHHRHQTSHSIPLQTLNTHGDSQEPGGITRNEPHRRTLSDRGRALFGSGRRENARQEQRYTPLSPTALHAAPRRRPERPMQSPIVYVSAPSGEHQRIPDEDDEAEYSPVGDRGGFQEAIGFAGLSFNAASPSPEEADTDQDATPPRVSRASRMMRESLPSIRTSRDSLDRMTSIQLDDGPAFFSPGPADEEDTMPLTDTSRLRPSVLDGPATPEGQRHDRNPRSSPGSGLAARFSSLHRSNKSGSHLGDELHNLEGGGLTPDSASRSPNGRGRSLSNASTSGEAAIRRTGTILRDMSLRVVNLSNEPEPVDRTVARKSTERKRHRSPSPGPNVQDFGASLEPALDGPAGSPRIEKPPSIGAGSADHSSQPPRDQNPLKGKSFGIFPPDSRVRLRLLELITNPLIEPMILVLIIVQTIILTIDSAPSVYSDERPSSWGGTWADYTIFVIFCVYTVEITIKCIVSGFILNPVEYSTIDRSHGLRKALMKKADDLFALQRKPTQKHGVNPLTDSHAPPSLLRTFTVQDFDNVPGNSRQAQKFRLAHRAFLRHSFNRVDFVAVVSFWISIIIGALGVESQHRVWVFRMMSCLRILRLLYITNGTAIILRSLKRAAPTLLNVGFLIGFFWLLFAIIGVQSFKSSLRRQCQTFDPIANQIYFLNETKPIGFCGGWQRENGENMPWLTADGRSGAATPKGYICPIGSQCVENVSPYSGTVSYDNILNSLELVFVIMSTNTFSDLMYYLTDTDYLAAALFTAIGVVILSLWLINLLIAVITSSFQIIREESRSSAFGSDEHEHEYDEKDEEAMQPRRVSTLKKAYDKTYWVWIIVIVYGLVIQSLRSDTMGTARMDLLNVSEVAVTLVLVGEMIFRIIADWRDFSHHRRNWVDLFLAVVTLIIQLPSIKNSGMPYAWLTIFQIVRIYRVVLAVTITRDLILLVLRYVSGVANLILFSFLLTFLVSIFAVQLFRGNIPQKGSGGDTIQTTFATVYNSFLGMYQIFSSENWTSILYSVVMYDLPYNTHWISAAFIILWFILGFLIVLPMFIAVIQENFDVSEDQKRLQQVRTFLLRKEMGTSNNSALSLSSIFKFGHVKRQDPLDFGSAASDMLLKDAVVKDFLDEQLGGFDDDPATAKSANGNKRMTMSSVETRKAGFWTGQLERIRRRIFTGEPNPFYARLKLTRPFEELDPRVLAKEVLIAAEQRKANQRDYLRRYPKYNVSMYIFKPSNPIRRFCQRIVGPGRGNERIDGLMPYPRVWYAFSAFIYLAIVAMVVLACITTPLFQKNYFEQHGFRVTNWFVFTDIAFAAIFTFEAIIKVVADGFFFTPNAYFRSSWGFIDGIVLITLWANVLTYLLAPTSGSRTIGAFKALRALRLLNVSNSARDTFHSVIVLGGWKVLSAAFVSLSLLVPFAIYGLNLFAGTMQSCNDDGDGNNINNLTDCVGEFSGSPFAWNVLSPRQVANNYYDFDNFGNALFILFQIVSQEGWIDVQWSAQSITGIFTAPNENSRQGNAMFFVIFNLLGAVFVLTLFISVFMRNYTEQTGVAFLTADQRSWLEFRKLLRQVAPSKRPSSTKQMGGLQQWCYRRAVRKSGIWQRAMTITLLLHLILLCTEYYPEPYQWSLTKVIIFFLFTLFYIATIVVRIVGLSWTRFRKSAWDIYSVLSISATCITTLLVFTNFNNSTFVQAHKMCLDSVVLLLIPRNNQLDQLFKTAAASLTAISNLLATWFVLFLVYAIALTQTFGLTRFAESSTDNLNVRTVPKALILLFRCSMGEGWNQIMEDFARIRAPYCNTGSTYFDGDCGSASWSRALFVSWNILSMYIFVNLFISLIYESFSYVYQRSNGLSIISREEIRRFKQAWAEHDPEGTGYISKAEFPKFLNELSGVFEMRIYDGDFTVRSIMEDCSKKVRTTSLPLGSAPIGFKTEIDLALLNRRLAELPVNEIRRRRARMNTFYEEVLVSSDPDRGISFNTLLMILAHYKVINDNKSLKLEEFLRRRARLQRVEEAVNRNIVKGFFDTLYWSRQFRRYKDGKERARMTELPSFGVPEIFVQDEEGEQVDNSQGKAMNIPSVSVTPVDYDPTDTAESLGVGRAGTSGSDADPHTPAGSVIRHRAGSVQTTSSDGSLQEHSSPHLVAHHRPSPSTSSQASIQPDWHFAAALENTSASFARPSPPGSPGFPPATAGGNRSRANSAVSQNEMMGMFETSAWGESMRRSFTQKRGSSTRRPSQQ